MKEILKLFVRKQSILGFSIAFCAGLILTSIYIYDYSKKITTINAIEDARSYSKALSSFRTLYTSLVVKAVKDSDIEVTHDFLYKEKAIPLPATFTSLMGQEMGKKGGGGEAFLYSPFPFPWKQKLNGGLQDEFSKNAWEALNANPEEPYYEVEILSGVPILRYATADKMRAACIRCHNTHPKTPKNDWKVGDVRGVLEVRKPIGASITAAQGETSKIFLLVIGVGLIGIIGLFSSLYLTGRIDMMASFPRFNPGPLIRVNSEGVILLANPATEKFFGKSLKGKFWTEFSNISITKIKALISCDGSFSQEIELNDRDMVLQYRGNSQMKVLFIFGIDLTERKKLEKELEQERQHSLSASKLAAIGEMSGQIAHEMNTPLGAITLTAQSLKKKVESGRFSETLFENQLDLILKVSHKLSRIIDSVRKLSKGDDSESYEKVSVISLVEDTLLLCEGRTKKHSVDLKTQFNIENSAEVDCHSTEIGQVLINLVNNSIDAMKEISAENREIKVEISEDDRFFSFSVSDEGSGIPIEIQDKIFEPKFSTKSLAEGTGFGLALSRQIISKHGGNLDLDRNRKETTFKFTLPKYRQINEDAG